MIDSDGPNSTDISVIIVTWNVGDLLIKCIQSLMVTNSDPPSDGSPVGRSRPTVQIIVVDSNSSDNTLDLLQQLRDAVEVIACPENVGYARGNNIGAQRARGKYLLFLNPDTEVLPGALEGLWDALESSGELGVVGPDLRRKDGGQHLLPRTLPTLMGTIFEATLLVPFTPDCIFRCECVYAPGFGRMSVEWVLGAALMLPTDLFSQLGGFDERFLLYSEEKDLCARVLARGLQVCIVGHSHIMHLGGQSTEKMPILRHLFFWDSHILYFQKHKSKLEAELLRSIAIVNYLLESLCSLCRAIVDRSASRRGGELSMYLRTAWQLALGPSRRKSLPETNG